MAFNPMTLPGPVLEAYKMELGAWPLVVDRAIRAGINDANAIGNMVFYLHHPKDRLSAAGRRNESYPGMEGSS